MNVSDVSIKIDMPTSQYGTLELQGKRYNVHVTKLEVGSIPSSINSGPMHIFHMDFLGTQHVEPEVTWEDSYEAI